MSGHSKWATIKHKKAATDSKRGQIFTKLIRAITVAVRDGGPDINSNFKLRLAVEKARQVNMPKVNIDRAIERGSGGADGVNLTEAVYEGFGPGNVSCIVEVLTDNKNRTASEIKKIFDKAGGRLGQPGSVSFLFDKKGRLVVNLTENKDELMLKLIDLGAEEIELIEEGVEVITPPTEMMEMKSRFEAQGLVVSQASLVYLPKTYLKLEEELKQKALTLLEALDDYDDVQEVYSNLYV